MFTAEKYHVKLISHKVRSPPYISQENIGSMEDVEYPMYIAHVTMDTFDVGSCDTHSQVISHDIRLGSCDVM